jgi:hypothetical protein
MMASFKRTTPLLAFASLAFTSATKAEDDGGQFSWIKTAKTACAASDFKQFFEAYARSAEVRAEYTADTVSVARNGQKSQIAGNEYRAFPIGMIDHSWVSSLSAMRLAEGIDKPFEYMDLEFNTASDNRVRVDYSRVDYALGSPSEGGDEVEAPNAKTRVGTPGYVIFYPTKDCWELVQDTVGGDAEGSQ